MRQYQTLKICSIKNAFEETKQTPSYLARSHSGLSIILFLNQFFVNCLRNTPECDLSLLSFSYKVCYKSFAAKPFGSSRSVEKEEKHRLSIDD